MSTILRQGEAALWYLLGSPSTRTEGLVLATLCVLSAILVLGRMERATNVPRSGPLMTVSIALVGIVAVLSSYILLTRYVTPALGYPHGYPGMLIASILISALVVIPTMCIFQGASARTGAASWGVSLCAAIFVVVIARTGFNVVEAGSEQAQQSKARSAEVEKFIDDPLKDSE